MVIRPRLSKSLTDETNGLTFFGGSGGGGGGGGFTGGGGGLGTTTGGGGMCLILMFRAKSPFRPLSSWVCTVSSSFDSLVTCLAVISIGFIVSVSPSKERKVYESLIPVIVIGKIFASGFLLFISGNLYLIIFLLTPGVTKS